MSELQAGIAEAVITPPLGIDLTGFGGRPGPSSTVLDDLHARAVVFEDRAAAGRVAVVALDLLGLAPELVDAIRGHVARLTGIGPESLLLNCSHTHAGPATMTLRGLGERDAAYEDVLVRTVAGAVRMACDRLAPARLALGSATARIGINRRQHHSDGRTVLGANPEGACDPTVTVLRVDGDDGQSRAVLFSHATHPVVLGGESTAISADLPGPAVAFVRRAGIGGAARVPALFLQGCCGDINPVRRGDYETVNHLGRVLGAAAFQGAEEAAPIAGTPIAAVAECLMLPLQPPVPAPEARVLRDQAAVRAREAEERLGRDEEYGLRPSRGMLAWAEEYLRLAEAGEAGSVSLQMQCLRIGDLALVAIAAEVFTEIGQAIAAAAAASRPPVPHTLVLGYTNGLIGYLPTASAYPLGGYEVDTAFKYFGTLMVTPESERLVLDAAARGLATLWPERARA